MPFFESIHANQIVVNRRIDERIPRKSCTEVCRIEPMAVRAVLLSLGLPQVHQDQYSINC